MNHPNEEQRTAIGMADLTAIALTLSTIASKIEGGRQELVQKIEEAQNYPIKLPTPEMEEAFKSRLSAIYSTALDMMDAPK